MFLWYIISQYKYFPSIFILRIHNVHVVGTWLWKKFTVEILNIFILNFFPIYSMVKYFFILGGCRQKNFNGELFPNYGNNNEIPYMGKFWNGKVGKFGELVLCQYFTCQLFLFIPVNY